MYVNICCLGGLKRQEIPLHLVYLRGFMTYTSVAWKWQLLSHETQSIVTVCLQTMSRSDVLLIDMTFKIEAIYATF